MRVNMEKDPGGEGRATLNHTCKVVKTVIRELHVHMQFSIECGGQVGPKM